MRWAAVTADCGGLKKGREVGDKLLFGESRWWRRMNNLRSSGTTFCIVYGLDKSEFMTWYESRRVIADYSQWRKHERHDYSFAMHRT